MKSASLRAKFFVVFASVVMLIGGIGYFSLTSLNQISEVFEDLSHNDLQRLSLLQNIDLDMLNLHHVMVSEQTASNNRRLAVTEQKKLLDDTTQSVRTKITSYKDHVEEDDEEKTGTHIDEVASRVEAVLKDSGALIEARNKKDAKATQLAESDLARSQGALEEKLDQTVIQEQAQIAEEDEGVEQRSRQNALAAYLITASATLAAVGIGLWISRYLVKGLSTLRGGAVRIANGDFSQLLEIKSKDEIGQLASAFNQMSDRLRDSYRRLALEKQRDETLLESLGEGLVVIDEKTTISLMNSQATTLLDLPDSSKALGVPLNHLVTLYDQQGQPISGPQTPAVKALESVKRTEDDLVFKRRDGTKIVLGISATPFLLDNQVAGAIMIFRDITKEKEIDRMKTEFISLASHQLRTPLSAIKWFAEMLVNGDAGQLNDEQKDFAQNIADSTERMIDLVNSLLNISRIESGRIIVDPKPTDLQELVTGIINDLKAKTEDKQQTLVVSVHKELGKINIDPHLIGQVYMNFLTNAIKYTPKGGEVSVFISRKGDEVVSQITDNGYGIPKAQQERVFQKFFRAENVAKVETDGTGLGLYLVKAIIESSGGKVWFESEEGKGTTFWFSLPMSGMKAKEGEVTLDV